MKTIGHCIALVVTLVLAGYAPVSAQDITDDLQLAGPFDYRSLTLYLIEGADSLKHSYLSLAEALRTGRATIHENNSQTLWIENHSDSDLYVQSSDLIKGGQQDRMIANDMIVPARQTPAELTVFCVEHDRSFQRGAEPVQTFSTSEERAPIGHMRITAQNALTSMLLSPTTGGLTAPDPQQLQLLQSLSATPQFSVLEDAMQESIWKDVKNVQTVLTHVLRDSVTRNGSPSSLELALEHEAVRQREEDFMSKLGNILKDHPRAIGMVYLIQGKIRGADLYGSPRLFAAMWLKLVRSMSVETVLASGQESRPVQIDSNEIYEFLRMADRGKTVTKNVNDRTMASASESNSAYLFESRDRQRPAYWLHRSYVVRQ